MRELRRAVSVAPASPTDTAQLPAAARARALGLNEARRCPPPFGGARPRTAAAHRSQQSLALRVALGPPATVRAASAQRASALEAAVSRAVYVLVHTYGQRAVLAAEVPLELRPRLEAFCAELF